MGSGRTARLPMHDQRRAAPLRHECGLSSRADAADVGRNRVRVPGAVVVTRWQVDRLPGRRHDRSPAWRRLRLGRCNDRRRHWEREGPHARLRGPHHPAGLEPGRPACAVHNCGRSRCRAVRRNGPANTRAEVVRMDRAVARRRIGDLPIRQRSRDVPDRGWWPADGHRTRGPGQHSSIGSAWPTDSAIRAWNGCGSAAAVPRFRFRP